MLIKSRESWMLSENDVTDKDIYLNRRSFMKMSGAAALAGTIASHAQAVDRDIAGYKKDPSSLSSELTSYEAVTGYNNFYEFGMGKDDPAKYAHKLTTDPWTVKVSGLAEKTGTYALEDLIDFKAVEERIYRLRCVEAWSMVVPWIGIPLKDIIKKLEPKSEARYVAFKTLKRKSEMRGLRWPVLDWPYQEGLRLDEAMNPLTLMAVGLYGDLLPNQNGAPLRLVVPWKYGFKSIKSVVNIDFTRREPMTSWKRSAPREYGFYSNVNPEVDHPRWSQSTERRIGEWGRRDTLMFNGYEEQVAEMYTGMDLKKYF
ncbi:protein-methionine-sulfoxide reductase catalytic subunit MsrP [Temperatibacter marinus]|uniref:Protein-methionine-sulfoxide reductase catalytic subunit MsrP n=1 Tax=Temperatibacter marinus TaxID=1456591 RepID=A0AA52EFA5_9PROT|nr:protein-methionine-sulfoxide reductase catalytic subunit MsrP [Temperatibacter marinus]WND01467.1 protein-methionine-sulfoxide reductase catalytic subunit MsrP [Temperatibacter marinus]